MVKRVGSDTGRVGVNSKIGIAIENLMENGIGIGIGIKIKDLTPTLDTGLVKLTASGKM